MNFLIFRRCGLWLSAMFCLLTAASPAYAHHAMGGETPFTFEQGLISGFAHPVIGVDHLAFILGIGIATAFLKTRFITLMIFIVAALLGCILQLQGIMLPAVEIVIAASVVLIGVLILSGIAAPARAFFALFAIAGLFHGWAYGEGIIGAEQTPLLAYLLGFTIIQYLIAFAAMLVTRFLWLTESAVPLRIAGGAIAGFGAAFLIENVEKLIFPGIA